jgi:hypothetical protein
MILSDSNLVASTHLIRFFLFRLLSFRTLHFLIYK